MADIVANPGGDNFGGIVDSAHIMALTLSEAQRPCPRFICSNIQETDLAGHAQDVARYAERLQLVDGYLTHLMSLLDKDDVLVVMADHGNDPTIGHSQHTRECVPLLVWRPGVTGIRLGDRATLSDVGASVCEAFGAPAPQNGASFSHYCRGTHMTDRIEWLNASGYTYAHEHLHIDLSPFKHNDDCRLDDYALLRDEMKALMARGVRNIVEVTNRYMGRDVHFIARLMRDTGINVLLSTGYYQQDFYPEHVATRDAQTLAAEMIAEIECGVDGSGLRAGVIAEIGSSEGRITPDEAKMFHAAAWLTTLRAGQSPRIPVSAQWGRSSSLCCNLTVCRPIGW